MKCQSLCYCRVAKKNVKVLSRTGLQFSFGLITCNFQILSSKLSVKGIVRSAFFLLGNVLDRRAAMQFYSRSLTHTYIVLIVSAWGFLYDTDNDV